MLNSTKEQFNIFTALHKPHDERRLHSRFIANLLSPSSTHGKKYAFLYEFLKVLEIDYNFFRDVDVYPDEHDKCENSNIDILIIDRQTKNAIIIENKIFAGDSNTMSGGQLERYNKHMIIIEQFKHTNLRTFYLTLDGHDPSETSLGEFLTLENINGTCISYSDVILKWLEACLHLVYDSPFLRESIIQYKKLVEKMTGNQSDIPQRLDIRDIIGRNIENLNNAKMLFDNFKHVKWHTVRDFWDELADGLNNYGFKVIENHQIKM